MDQNPDGKAMIDYFVSIDILCNLNNHGFMLFLINVISYKIIPNCH